MFVINNLFKKGMFVINNLFFNLSDFLLDFWLRIELRLRLKKHYAPYYHQHLCESGLVGLEHE